MDSAARRRYERLRTLYVGLAERGTPAHVLLWTLARKSLALNYELVEENERLRGYVAVVASGIPREDLLEIERALNG